MDGSAALLAASQRVGRPCLWVGGAPRPVSEAAQLLARLQDATPCGWAADEPARRAGEGCSRAYLEGLRAGCCAVEAEVEEAEEAERQQAAAARSEALTVTAGQPGGPQSQAEASPALVGARVVTRWPEDRPPLMRRAQEEQEAAGSPARASRPLRVMPRVRVPRVRAASRAECSEEE
jgi:hypothetical protein